jgi:polyisoprenoid-binding protein YceI
MRYVPLLGLIILTACTLPPTDIAKAQDVTGAVTGVQPTDTLQIDTTASTFQFTGYGPGKAHSGTFTQFSGKLYRTNDSIVGASGTVQAASVDTGISGLDRHLRSDDFFHVQHYPTITFNGTIQNGTMTGPLTFLGTTKAISFPVDTTTTTMHADFLLNTTPFGLSYPGVHEAVRFNITMTS